MAFYTDTELVIIRDDGILTEMLRARSLGPHVSKSRMSYSNYNSCGSSMRFVTAGATVVTAYLPVMPSQLTLT